MFLFLLPPVFAADAVAVDPSAGPPPTAAELDAIDRYDTRSCGLGWGWAWPGASRFCLHRPVEGAVLGGLALGEVVATGALLASDRSPSIPLTGFQNLYITGLGLSAIDGARARRRPYTPTDSLGDLVSAPFRPAVLGKPGVWLGGGLLIGGAVALTVATSGGEWDSGARPNVFGVDLDPAVGVPVFAVVDATTFLHVAIGEEVLFRGVLQSGFTRGTNPVAGWVLGSAVFGLSHVVNVVGLEPEQRLGYLLVSIPYITLTGTVLGHVYRTYGYSLGPSVAIHFWYDAVLGGLAFAMNPDQNPFSARVTIPF